METLIRQFGRTTIWLAIGVAMLLVVMSLSAIADDTTGAEAEPTGPMDPAEALSSGGHVVKIFVFCGSDGDPLGKPIYEVLTHAGRPPKQDTGMLHDNMAHYSFDGDPRCAHGVSILNDSQSNVRSVFTLGDTRQTLDDFHMQGMGFAWIDGGHDEEPATSDLLHAVRLAIPLIAIDDTKTMPEVENAIATALRHNSTYRRRENPFLEFDARGVVFLQREATT